MRIVSRRRLGIGIRACASKALRIRFTSTCSSWMRSPTTGGSGSVSSKSTSAVGHPRVDVHQFGHFANQGVDVDHRLQGLGLGDEAPQAADDLRGPVGLLGHLVQRGQQFLGRRRATPGRSSRLQAWA